MSQPQRCVACGYVGYDVGPRLVWVGDPLEPVKVQVRCTDSEVCADHQPSIAAILAVAVAAADSLPADRQLREREPENE